jgi:hypothetical protein
MATEQQVIDLKYDILKAEQEKTLKSIFGQEIISWAYLNNLSTFQEISQAAISVGISGSVESEIKGIEYLKNITGVSIDRSETSSIDLSAALDLTSIVINLCPNLSSFGNCLNLTKVTQMYIYQNGLTSLGRLSKMNKVSLIVAYSNNFGTNEMNQILKDLKTAYDSVGGGNLTSCNFSNSGIPTGGVNNAEYLYLVGQGVSVTIQTS